ncbi:MAG: purine biosynthesis protein PurH [Eubacteriales bacterium]|nr:purine biosynthesis protein PurH [Eubacteriales bacterium]
MSYLIKDTTEEERRRIVEESLGNLDGACDGCAARVAEMYDAYIRGEKELREINMAFSTRYVKGDMDRDQGGAKSCLM